MAIDNQPLHLNAVGDHVTHCHGRVIVRVEVNDAHIALSVDIGHPGDVGVRQQVIAADDDRDRVFTVLELDRGNVSDVLADFVHGALGA